MTNKSTNKLRGKMQLLSVDNPKTRKGEKHGYLSLILHLAPALLSGFNVCPRSTPGCRAACLNTAGKGGIFPSIQHARIRKTRMLFEQRAVFMAQLIREIAYALTLAKSLGLILCVRLNGTSDILWELIQVADINGKQQSIMDIFPEVQFYDYTKIPNRVPIPANYHLTFSRSETMGSDDLLKVMRTGMNVAVVFSGPLPVNYLGYPVINGDEHDLRFLDPQNIIVGLKAKGRAKQDQTGFVVSPFKIL